MNHLFTQCGLLILLLVACKKQPAGCLECNDPAAKNYSSTASGDTTCCIYGKVKPDVKTVLAESVRETSGLLFAAGKLWTHNDSGGDPALYAVDTTNGSVTQTIVLDGVTNIDWEDVTQSPTHVYVGDIGNNNGDRKNLRVYRFPLSALSNTDDTLHVTAETIEFSYEDQTDFTARKQHHFDCEALVYAANQLFLFTKNWDDLRCNVYAIPAAPGRHTAQSLDSFDTRGLITGADLSPSGKELVLVGYNTQTLGVFLWKLSGFSGTQFLSGDRKLVKLGDFSGVGQAEGICYPNASTWYMSAEKSPLLPARLYRMDTAKY